MTKFAEAYIDANRWLAKASEQDGSEMKTSLVRAAMFAKQAENYAYEHSDMEQMMSKNLIGLIDSIRNMAR